VLPGGYGVCEWRCAVQRQLLRGEPLLYDSRVQREDASHHHEPDQVPQERLGIRAQLPGQERSCRRCGRIQFTGYVRLHCTVITAEVGRSQIKSQCQNIESLLVKSQIRNPENLNQIKSLSPKAQIFDKSLKLLTVTPYC